MSDTTPAVRKLFVLFAEGQQTQVLYMQICISIKISNVERCRDGSAKDYKTIYICMRDNMHNPLPTPYTIGFAFYCCLPCIRTYVLSCIHDYLPYIFQQMFYSCICTTVVSVQWLSGQMLQCTVHMLYVVCCVYCLICWGEVSGFINSRREGYCS